MQGLGCATPELCRSSSVSPPCTAFPSCHSLGKPFWPNNPEQKGINPQMTRFHCCFAQPRSQGGDCTRVGAVGAGHARGEQISHQHHLNRQSSGLWGLLALGAAPVYQNSGFWIQGDQGTVRFPSSLGTQGGHRVPNPGFPSLVLLSHSPHTPSTGRLPLAQGHFPQLEAPGTMGHFEFLSLLAESSPQDFPDFPISPVAVSVPNSPFSALCPSG